jgi:hypothetical protein
VVGVRVARKVYDPESVVLADFGRDPLFSAVVQRGRVAALIANMLARNELTTESSDVTRRLGAWETSEKVLQGGMRGLSRC